MEKRSSVFTDWINKALKVWHWACIYIYIYICRAQNGFVNNCLLTLLSECLCLCMCVCVCECVCMCVCVFVCVCVCVCLNVCNRVWESKYFWVMGGASCACACVCVCVAPFTIQYRDKLAIVVQYRAHNTQSTYVIPKQEAAHRYNCRRQKTRRKFSPIQQQLHNAGFLIRNFFWGGQIICFFKNVPNYEMTRKLYETKISFLQIIFLCTSICWNFIR